LIRIDDGAAERGAQLRHHHLLTQHSPRGAAQLRFPQLPLEPAFLVETEQRSRSVRNDWIV
jgi:hypothetical protein